MESDSDRDLDRPWEEADRAAGEDREQGAAEPAGDAERRAMEGQDGERRRLPSIDDYDWEQEIERLARRLSPHGPSAEAADGGAVETQDLRPAADPPASLRPARHAAAAQPQWPEAGNRRPVGTVLAVAVPVLAIAAALPFVRGVPGTWTEELGWLLGAGNGPVMGVIFQPAPYADAALPLRHGDALPPATQRQAIGTAEAAAPVPLYRQVALPPAGEPGVRPPRAIAAPAAEAGAAGSAPPKDELAAPERRPAEAGAAERTRQQPPLRSLSNREIEELLDRGNQLLDIGDIASARLLFQLVAEAGDPRGAKAMGMTFDPSIFAELPVAGMAHDRAQAEIWYDRSDAMPALAAPADGELAVSVPPPPGGDAGRRSSRRTGR